jgi:subtilisin
MAEKKDDAQSPQRRTATSGAGQDQSVGAEKPPASVARRKQRYLIGFRSLPGLTATSADPFLERLALMDGVEIVRRLRPRGPQALATANGAPVSEIIVAKIDEQRGEALRQGAPPHVIIEVDARLGYFDMAASEPTGWQLGTGALPFPRPRRDIRFRVLGDGDRPLANAGVYLYGPGFPAQAVTDSSGQATLQTFSVDGASILAVYVRPASDHWERYIQNPLLDPSDINTIRLSPLGRTPAKFPGERPHSWGQRMMRFDRISADWSGTGIKIGLIDSGCDTSHPILRQVAQGADLTRDGDAQSWTLDEIGHGTHCAGIVAGAANSASGMIGCAPGSELHVFKVVPGGYFSDLIEALDQCIERRLDIVQIGVSGEQFSELVAQKINEARLNGIACIVGVGNSGGLVQFPGNVPGVLSVAAIGKLGECPMDTRHAQTATAQPIGFAGVFAANFSCWGPQVGVCAPGVAIISSVPGGGYAAWDGTAMAAAHITGFAAVLRSNHPALQSTNYTRPPEQNVAILFDLIRSSALPYLQAEPNRIGAGLPDLQQVPAAPSYRPYPAGIPISPPQGPMFWPGLGAGPLADPLGTILRLRANGPWA